MIIDEVSFNDNKTQHESNISAIKLEIAKLQENEFLNGLDLLNNIVITNNVEYTIQKHGYVKMNKGFYAATHEVGDKYDVIIRYDNLHFNNEGAVLSDVKNYIFHEFQHIYDHKKYDAFIKNYANENNIDETRMKVIQSFFFEFNASYCAQKYYSKKGWKLETTRFRERFLQIKNTLDDLKIINVKCIKQLNDDAFYFSQEVMYDLAIVSGANASDNEKEKGYKVVSLSNFGINDLIDDLLERFLNGVNQNINDNENLIKYLTTNEMCIFDYICGLIKEKIKPSK